MAMAPPMNPLNTVRRIAGGIKRRLNDRLRGETDATFFDLNDVRKVNDILRPHGLPELPHKTSNSFAGERVKRIFEFRQDLRELFPLAMTPHPDRAKFLTWFASNGRHEFDVSIEECLYFLTERDGLPDRGLVASYCLQPDWQRDQPNALTPHGWDEFKTYIAQKFDLESRWLKASRLPADSQQSAKSGELGVNVLGHFRYASGLQEAAVGIVRGLQTSGIPATCRDMPVIFPCDWSDRERYQGLEVYDTTLYVAAVNTFPDIWYPRSGLFRRDGVRRIAVWYWELEQLPEEWLPKIAWADEVWAPTRFIAEAFRKAVNVPVVPMLPGVEIPTFHAKARRELVLPEDRTLFLFSFDMGSVMARKNPLAVIAAFRAAFRADDSVHLVIKVSRGSSDPSSLALLQAAIGEVSNASLLDRVLTRDDALSLLAAADCYVSLHRSEGLGLGLAESMLMGKPVIATRYSGNLDFMTPDTAHLIDFELVPVGGGMTPYPKECLWADPSIDSAAAAMRAVFDRPDDAKAMGSRAKTHAEVVLSTASAGRRMGDRLRELAEMRRTHEATR